MFQVASWGYKGIGKSRQSRNKLESCSLSWNEDCWAKAGKQQQQQLYIKYAYTVAIISKCQNTFSSKLYN